MFLTVERSLLWEIPQKTDKTILTNFWKGVQSEFRKITWPDRDKLLKQSIAVVTISIVLGLIITLLDTLLQYGVNFLTM